jgi:predicted HNH restriction endonuclease
VAATDESESTLPDAIDALYRAVGALIDPAKKLIDGRVLAGPSQYEILVSEIPATSSAESNFRGVAKSIPTVWLDAVDLRIQIDERVRTWLPKGDSTPARLRVLASRRWRPQDAGLVREISAEIQSWTISIQGLVNPAHVKEISEKCPNCGKRWHYKQHAGETVKTAALQLITSHGCTCQVCKVFYPPEKFLWLARLLGRENPTGVIG